MKREAMWTIPGGVLLLALVLACGCSPGTQLENGEFTAQLNGFRIQYAVHGRGPVLMVLPNSWGVSHEGLRGLFRPLEKRLTLVYFDPRGVGRSGATDDDVDRAMLAVRADLDALRRHLGLSKIDVLGWSNGAMNLLRYAAEYPASLESAILVHGVANLEQADYVEFSNRRFELFDRYGDYLREIRSDGPTAEEKNAQVRQFIVGEWFPAICEDEARCRELLPRIFENASLSWEHQIADDPEAGTNFDVRATLPQIQARVLVIAGAHDMFPPTKGEAMARALPNASFELFENSGHFAPVEQPDEFAAAVWSFLRVGK